MITGVAQDADTAKVAVLGVKNQPGVAHMLFSALAESHIVVDMIVQSVREIHDDKTDMIFTISRNDLDDTREVLCRLQAEGRISDVVYNDKVAKVSISGRVCWEVPERRRRCSAPWVMPVSILILSAPRRSAFPV